MPRFIRLLALLITVIHAGGVRAATSAVEQLVAPTCTAWSVPEIVAGQRGMQWVSEVVEAIGTDPRFASGTAARERAFVALCHAREGTAPGQVRRPEVLALLAKALLTEPVQTSNLILSNAPAFDPAQAQVFAPAFSELLRRPAPALVHNTCSMVAILGTWSDEIESTMKGLALDAAGFQPELVDAWRSLPGHENAPLNIVQEKIRADIGVAAASACFRYAHDLSSILDAAQAKNDPCVFATLSSGLCLAVLREDTSFARADAAVQVRAIRTLRPALAGPCVSDVVRDGRLGLLSGALSRLRAPQPALAALSEALTAGANIAGSNKDRAVIEAALRSLPKGGKSSSDSKDP